MDWGVDHHRGDGGGIDPQRGAGSGPGAGANASRAGGSWKLMLSEDNLPTNSLLSSRAKRGIWVLGGIGKDPDSSSLALLGMTGFFLRRGAQLILLALALFTLLGAGD